MNSAIDHHPSGSICPAFVSQSEKTREEGPHQSIDSNNYGMKMMNNSNSNHRTYRSKGQTVANGKRRKKNYDGEFYETAKALYELLNDLNSSMLVHGRLYLPFLILDIILYTSHSNLYFYYNKVPKELTRKSKRTKRRAKMTSSTSNRPSSTSSR